LSNSLGSRDGEGEQHLAAHRVDVRHRVGRGAGAPRVRVVHDGRKKVDGLDDGDVVTDPVDGRVVGSGQANEQVALGVGREVRGTLERREHSWRFRSHLRPLSRRRRRRR